MFLVHAAKKRDWEGSNLTGYYGDFSIKKDGFIHCSTPDSIVDVANDNLRGITEPMLLLKIDTDLLENKIRWEKRGNKGIEFPHLYGLLNTSAVVSVYDFNRDQDGYFFLPKNF